MNFKISHLSHIFMSTLFKEKLMHLPFDFIFDRVMALAWFKCSGGAWYSACSAFISGVILISLALCADGAIGNFQEKVLKQYGAGNSEIVSSTENIFLLASVLS